MIEAERLTLWLPDGAALLRLLRDDLERGALFVPTDAALDLATPVTIQVQVGSHPRVLELEGTVVHVARTGDGGSMGPGVGLLLHGAARAMLAADQLLAELEPLDALLGPECPAEERPWAERSASASCSREPTPAPQIAVLAHREPRAPSPVPRLPVREVISAHAAAGTRDESGVERLKRLLRAQQESVAERARSLPTTRIAHDQELAQAAAPATEQQDAGAGQRTPTAVQDSHTSPPPRANSPGDVPRDQPSGAAGQLRSLLDKAWAAQLRGDLLGAKSWVQLALALDPVSTETRDLLRFVEEGLATRPDSGREPTPASGDPGRLSSPASGAADERPGEDRGRLAPRARVDDKDLSQWQARPDKPALKEPR